MLISPEKITIYLAIVLSYRTIYPENIAQFLLFYGTLSDSLYRARKKKNLNSSLSFGQAALVPFACLGPLFACLKTHSHQDINRFKSCLYIEHGLNLFSLYTVEVAYSTLLIAATK